MGVGWGVCKQGFLSEAKPQTGRAATPNSEDSCFPVARKIELSESVHFRPSWELDKNSLSLLLELNCLKASSPGPEKALFDSQS